jgi:DNA invertase Pin-like site-specific DNA recombinase
MADPSRSCVIYARTSTTDQSPENQVVLLRQMAEQRGLKIHRVYVEQVSGRKKRPLLDELLNEAHRAPPWRTVLVFALDRLGRNMTDVLGIVQRLDDLGITIVSSRESWTETQGPARKLILSVVAWCLEAEVAQIRERTKAGLERARRRGVRLGRPPAQVDVEQLARLRDDGLSYRAIGRRMGIGASTAHRLLKAHDTVMKAATGSSEYPADEHPVSSQVLGDESVGNGWATNGPFGHESQEAAE